MNQIKYIAFDADDTLWINEPKFQETEKKYISLLEEYLPAENISKELLKTEKNNLHLYGFGIKSFTLSMIEAALHISHNKIPQHTLQKIMDLGKELLVQPVQLIDGIEGVLEELKQQYTLIVATKGDLLDQEKKLEASGLSGYFHHIEIMSNKQPANYQKLFNHLEIKPTEFLMVGNSMKSDILPVLQLGGKAVYIPFHTTWEHEKVKEKDIPINNFFEITTVSLLPAILHPRHC